MVPLYKMDSHHNNHFEYILYTKDIFLKFSPVNFMLLQF